MLKDNLVHKGDVARVLKTVWLSQGKVAQLKLAKLAEKNIKRLLLSTSLNEGMVSEPLK